MRSVLRASAVQWLISLCCNSLHADGIVCTAVGCILTRKDMPCMPGCGPSVIDYW